MTEIRERIQQNKTTIDDALSECLSIEKVGNSRVAEAVRYSVLGGGKRLRSFLVHEFSGIFGGLSDAALQFSLAVELGHAASLIHDDLPCMDNSELRHGKPSCHVRFGEDVAVLAGDALLSMAFELVNANPYVSAEVARYAVQFLSKKSGLHGMCLGQDMDLAKKCNSLNELEVLYDLKTGSSMQVAVLFGFLSSNKIPNDTELSSMMNYAKKLGYIFQMKDDILDVLGNNLELGKSSGSDARNGTKTILSFMTLHEANKKIEILAEEASQIFKDPILMELPFYLVKREK